MNLKTSVGDIELENCILNASGALCETEEQILNLDNSELGGIVSKTCTLEKRDGNPTPRYYSSGNKGNISINSMGLPNMGYKIYKNIKTAKPYFISISPMNIEHFEFMIKELNGDDNIYILEINLSCPNIIGLRQIGYDPDQVEKILSITTQYYKGKIGLKLPPYFENFYFENITKLVIKYDVSFVTCINSLGNGLIIDPVRESTVIKPKGGIGGIGGSVIKSIALSNVYQFRKLLPENVDIIGCGGIVNGVDVFEHILAGASAVQIGTILVDEGLDCVHRLLSGLKNIMKSKGYTTIKDFKGKLKTI